MLLFPVLIETLTPLVRVAAQRARELGDTLFEDLSVSSRIHLRIVVSLGLLRALYELLLHSAAIRQSIIATATTT